MKTHIAINGAGGRMGQRLVALAKDDAQLQVVAAIDVAEQPRAGPRRGRSSPGIGTIGVPIEPTICPLSPKPDCVIDFSVPEGTMAILPLALRGRSRSSSRPPGTTRRKRHEIEAAAHQTAVLFAPNMSLVVNLLFKLTRLAAEALKGKGFDAEIIERHHRFKKDSPSGTALRFAEIIREVQGGHFVHGREGLVGERTADEIGIHAVRGGDNVGEHAIIFTTLGETLELVHKGHNRDSYARGALSPRSSSRTAPPGATRWTTCWGYDFGDWRLSESGA